MILDVNDFGCVPDGRFLEKASIKAGSSVLIESDGILRPKDVGKNIAIPGAVDLRTTIAGLAEHREVRDAKMTKDSPVLTGTLFDPAKKQGHRDEVFTSAHIGRRITVSGAGPNQQTLVTDIVDLVEVLGKAQPVLAKPASQDVSGVRVILNKPDHVALGNYARRTVKDLTIDLKDRTITDGEMVIGGRALFSKTAKFSSEDLDKEVTIKDAGLLVTTIQSFQSSTQVTLAAPARRRVDNTQADIWQCDSRPGLAALLASLATQDVPSAEIVFGPGIYDFQRLAGDSEAVRAIIELRGLKNLTIRGSGPGVTILRLMPNQDLVIDNTHVIETHDCKNITFRDFSIHGAYLTMGNANEQMHGLFLNAGSENIAVERVRVFQTGGDGIRFLGEQKNKDTGLPNKVRNVRVEGCQLIQNKRTGIAVQRAVELVSVRNCYIEMIPPSTDACIDLEPSVDLVLSGLGPTDILIDSNFMRHNTPTQAVSLSGDGAANPARRIKFSNNEIEGGNIFCTDINELTIQNNTVRVTHLGNAQRIPIHVALGGDSIIITGNLLVNDDPVTKSVISLGGTSEVHRALVANNLCFTRAGAGIQCLSGHDISIDGNFIVATGECNNGILVSSQSTTIDSVSVRHNDITVQDTGTWNFGVHIGANQTHHMRHVSVIGNSIRGADKGIFFQDDNAHSGFEQPPVCALNRIADGIPPLIGIQNLPHQSIVVAGAGSRGGAEEQSGIGRVIAGLGNPNETGVPGNTGDIFQRLDGKRGETLYVNEPDNGTTSVWVNK